MPGAAGEVSLFAAEHLPLVTEEGSEHRELPGNELMLLELEGLTLDLRPPTRKRRRQDR